MYWTNIVSLVGFFASLSSIIFAVITYKKGENQDARKKGVSEGVILSEIGYIKACIERIEKSLNLVEEKYNNVLERLSKAEEALSNVTKRVDELYK